MKLCVHVAQKSLVRLRTATSVAPSQEFLDRLIGLNKSGALPGIGSLMNIMNVLFLGIVGLVETDVLSV